MKKCEIAVLFVAATFLYISMLSSRGSYVLHWMVDRLQHENGERKSITLHIPETGDFAVAGQMPAGLPAEPGQANHPQPEIPKPHSNESPKRDTKVEQQPPPPQTQILQQNAADTTDTPDYLKNTAFVTMCAGDSHAKLVVALIQSLRDTQTRIPNVLVLLPAAGSGSERCKRDPDWLKSQGRQGQGCAAVNAAPGDIISPEYLDALTRLDAKYRVIQPIPRTPYTEGIPGGKDLFWGMALNKLSIFNLTEFRKILWMDADTMILKSVDDLLLLPMLSGGITYACCNKNSPPSPSGGIWVVEPSLEIGVGLWNLMSNPVPDYPDHQYEYWHFGDMQIIRVFFGDPWNKPFSVLWPHLLDGRHGRVAGLRYFPEYAAMSELEFNNSVRDYHTKKIIPEGFQETWGKPERPAWRALDVRYDQCIGLCECLPERDMPDTFVTVHFSCMQKVGKPSGYNSDHEFMSAIYNHGLSCTRHYFMVWYQKYMRAMGSKLPGPYWTGPPMPIWNATHDEIVRANALKERA